MAGQPSAYVEERTVKRIFRHRQLFDVFFLSAMRLVGCTSPPSLSAFVLAPLASPLLALAHILLDLAVKSQSDPARLTSRPGAPWEGVSHFIGPAKLAAADSERIQHGDKRKGIGRVRGKEHSGRRTGS